METLPNNSSALETTKSSDTLQKYFEEFKRKSITPIFKGAILAKGNELVTSQRRLVSLFERLQAKEIDYPESMKERIEDVDIYQGYMFKDSEKIEQMLFSLSLGCGLTWIYEEANGRYVGEKYSLSDDGIYNFLEEWGDDYEALEFFENCADYLSIK